MKAPQQPGSVIILSCFTCIQLNSHQTLFLANQLEEHVSSLIPTVTL